MEKSEALIIVAHPDDETIWMGGMILRNNNWKWTIISLCRANDLDRKPKFDRVCGIYNANGFISDLDDEVLHPIRLNEIVDRIKNLISKKNYKFIFTHGENGEYGHIRHIEVHKAVEEMVNNKELIGEKVYYFNYKKGKNVPYPSLIAPEPIEDADFVLKLTDKELESKKEIIRSIYGYPNDRGFELISCNKMESFSIK